MDKQQMATAGIIGLVAIGTIVYAVAVFGGRDKKEKREDFKAPALSEQVQTKDDYEKKLNKELREMPRKPKEAGILLNPFENVENVGTNTEDANLVLPGFKENETPSENQDTDTDIETQTSYTSVSKKQTEHRFASVPKKKVMPETIAPPDSSTSVPEVRSKSRYASSDLNSKKQTTTNNTYSASVFGEQKIFNSSLLKIRVLSPMTLESGIVIPRNTFVSGTVSFSGERVKIQITSIPYQNGIQKVNLNVYDANDGLEGIYVQGNAVNDINDQSTSDIADEITTYPGVNTVGIIKGVGSQVKKWTRKKSVTILDEHRLFLK